MEYIIIAAIIGLTVWGIYAYWIYITARRYGKRGDGRH
jgi:hypothetical protein